MRTRIRMAITAAALACASALFIATPGAIGNNGDPVKAGQDNTATAVTVLADTSKVSLAVCKAFALPLDGLVACGDEGLAGKGTSYGVFGEGGSIGVRGHGGPTGVLGLGAKTGVSGYASAGGTGVYGENLATTGIGVWGKVSGTGTAVYGQATTNGLGVFGASASGTGVKGSGGPAGVSGNGAIRGVQGTTSTGSGLYGENTGSTGIGVEGKTGGTGSAVYGQATANGVGVYGVSANGAGVWATSPTGTALQVKGIARFSRSGIAHIAAGNASMVVTLALVTASSMVIATAQQNGNVFVKAAVPAGGSFTLYLTGNAPAGGLKVAYFVLN